MRDVEQFASENSLGFSLASFRRDIPLNDVERFRDFAGLRSKSFSFDGNESDLPPLSKGLQYPCYILTDARGQILRIFAGTHPDETIRNQLTAQIKNESLIEKANSKLKGY